MKKKLIAALTSAAMVATMVPATAFAGTAVDKTITTAKSAAIEPYAGEKTAWETAWEAIKDMNPEKLSFSSSVDGLISAAADAYVTVMESTEADSVDETEEDIELLEKLVVAQWNLRLEKMQGYLDAFEGPITEDNVDLITPLGTDLNSYLGTSNNMYKILGADYINNTDLQDKIEKMKAEVTDLNTVLSDADNVYTAIKNASIPTGDNYTTTTLSDLEDIQDDYNNLDSAAKKEKVGNYSKLETAIAKAAELRKAVEEVDTLMTDVPDPSTITYADAKTYYDDFQKAWEKYDALGGDADSTGQKSVVAYNATNNSDNMATLKGYLDEYNEGKTKEAEVKELIGKLPNGATAEDALAVAQADSAYGKLSTTAISDSTTLVTEASGGNDTLALGYQKNVNKGVLDDAKDTITALLADTENGAANKEAAVKPVVDMINALSETSPAADVKAANDAYKALTDSGTAFDSVDLGDVESLKAAYEKLKGLVDAVDKADVDDQKAVEDFVAAVKKIADVAKNGEVTGTGDIDDIDTNDDTVNSAYVRVTGEAKAAYDALTPAQLAVIEAGTVADAQDAVEKLNLALENVEAFNNAEAAAKLINAVPDAETLDLTNAEHAQAVRDAKAAYDALTKAVQDQLVPQGLVASTDIIDAMNNAADEVAKMDAKDAAATVENAISSLPELPEKFASKADIDAAANAAKQAQDAYKALTDEQKEQVNNYQTLTNYENELKGKVQDYTDALYEEAEAIDTENLTAADAAKIAELVALVDGDYGVTLTDQTAYEELKNALADFQATTGNLMNATIEVADQNYTGEALTPAVTVKDSAGNVVNADEYMVFYENNTNVGTAVVTVIAKTGGLYTGAKNGTFKINGISLADATIDVANQSYTGSALRPAVTVKVGTTTLKANTDYTVTYSNNTNVGNATVTITGMGTYSGTATKAFTISKANLKEVANVTGVVSRYYTGKARTQTDLKVYVAGKVLSKSDYKVAYKNNKNVGKATLTITGQGNYTGTITKTFIVKPRKVANVKVTKGKKRVTVRYKKQNGARYQIYYKTTGSKAKTVKTAAVKRTIKKLKSGKTYTIKVRAYKKIGSKTYYGKYSKAKKVRVR